VASQHAAAPGYIIRGGIDGRERLRVVARVLRPATLTLFQRAGLQPGMSCLDVGCGGGDVAFDLARLVGAAGRVVAIDMDEVKLEIARREAQAQQLGNVEFRHANIVECELEGDFDFAFSRFVLSYLRDPAQALANIRNAVRPGGTVAIADIEFGAHFCEPHHPAFWRFVNLFIETVKRRGGDANLGPRLPRLLREGGFENVQVEVVQAAGIAGDVKLLAPITMENIVESVLAEELASREEVQQIVSELYEFTRDPGFVVSTPRIIEAWGVRPVA
jgi:SAM-dependent methyltransferase